MTSQIKDGGLSFHPHAGTVLICDFCGNIVPEITKRRPVVVVTPRLAHRDKLAIGPFSGGFAGDERKRH